MSEEYFTPSSDNNQQTSFRSVKPAKPYPEFPLFAHPSGQWAKKIRGRTVYFGKWDDPDAALTNYLRQKDDLHAGRIPRPDTALATVKDACNAFLNAKQDALDAGELSPRTWTEYRAVCGLLVERFGKGRLLSDLGAQDFTALRKHMAAKWGALRLANVIQYVRSVFKYAYDSELIDRPIRFGPMFKRPSRKVVRLHRAEQGKKLFAASEIRRLIDAAGVQLRAMILLGINCGMGNSDCGNLPLSAVDLDNAVLDYPRPKTGIARRCPLWPETVTALREALAKRREPKSHDDAKLVFVTKYGLSWEKCSGENPVSQETAKLLRKLHINGRKGLGFYTLRHTFRTIADEAKDQPATDHIMGHETSHMSSYYRESIADERLRAVTDHVRKWLFPSSAFLGLTV
jgi:integrase